MDLPAEIVDAFYTMLDARIRQMNDALADGDWTAFRRLVHQIAGTGASFGLPRLTDDGRNLERELAAGANDLQSSYAYVALCRAALDEREVVGHNR
jgi:HPt (histidine-containing phosphotransfer) domain-containing protein